MKFLVLLLLALSCQPVTKNPPVILTPPVVTPVTTVDEVEVTYLGHEASTPIGPEYPVADVKKVFTVKIEDTNYTASQKEKLRQAEALIAKIFNSEEYKSAVLSKKFTSTSLGQEEVYAKLFAGAEALQPAVNYQMDLKVTMYMKKYSNVIGYTTAKSLVVNTNLKYHQNYNVCEIASNLVHEWTHKMGFDHASASDYGSVPYAHGTIIKNLCPRFL